MNTGSSQHIPCRHLTDVFITNNTFYFISIRFFTNITCPLLGMPRYSKLIKEERSKMHRFVSMIVVFIPQHIGRSLTEKINQIFNYFLFTAHQFHHSRNIMRHEPTLLIRICFYTAIPFFKTCILWPCYP